MLLDESVALYRP